MAESTFKDHFSAHAVDYKRYRPGYPPALFAYLAARAPQRTLAWDCATGNGQAASQLASHFLRVIGTDASAAQIAHASGPGNVKFHQAPAEASGLPSGSTDLVTVAQALHWFQFDAFYAEARRVLKPAGVLAVWCYGLFSSTPQLDRVVSHFYREVLGAYWPEERRWIDQHYETLPFPFAELAAPQFAMRYDWSLSDLIGYLNTWSAVRRCEQAQGENPLRQIGPALEQAWPRNAPTVPFTWVVRLRVGRRD